jgi:hypothetical protein
LTALGLPSLVNNPNRTAAFAGNNATRGCRSSRSWNGDSGGGGGDSDCEDDHHCGDDHESEEEEGVDERWVVMKGVVEKKKKTKAKLPRKVEEAVNKAEGEAEEADEGWGSDDEDDGCGKDTAGVEVVVGTPVSVMVFDASLELPPVLDLLGGGESSPSSSSAAVEGGGGYGDENDDDEEAKDDDEGEEEEEVKEDTLKGAQEKQHDNAHWQKKKGGKVSKKQQKKLDRQCAKGADKDGDKGGSGEEVCEGKKCKLAVASKALTKSEEKKLAKAEAKAR